MKRLILWGAMVATAATASVWGTDLNPEGDNACGAGATTERLQPSTIIGDGEFAKIYENLEWRLGNLEISIISSDEGNWWTYDNNQGKLYVYMMVKFVKPAGFTTGTCNWQVKNAAGTLARAFIWDHRIGYKRWVQRSINQGGSEPPTEYFTVNGTDFDGNGVLWILIEAETKPYQRWMKCDVCDIHY